MDQSDTIDVLNKLIETSLDGDFGFRACAEHAKDAQLKTVLMHRADECREGAGELQSLVQRLGGDAEDSGTAGGAVHRGWVSVKGKLAGYTDKAMLEECERGEDVALRRYREALEKDLDSDVRTVVARQCDGVQRNHDQIRNLRNQARAMA